MIYNYVHTPCRFLSTDIYSSVEHSVVSSWQLKIIKSYTIVKLCDYDIAS